MKTKTKVLTSIISIMLACVLLFIGISICNNTNNYAEISASTRTVELSRKEVDAQSILDEFEDSTLTRKGSTVYFEGVKPLDLNALSEIDYISDSDLEELEDCSVKYNFSYDSESNIVTLTATATLSDGSIKIDEIKGIGFINDQNEIDAVMNVDGEGVLFSEMRNAGLIENCGWLSRIIKNSAKQIALVALGVAAVALVVATAGAAAPAVIAAGLGVATTVVTSAAAIATTIATYATITAAISAGVLLTAELVERYYPGCDAHEEKVNGQNTVFAKFNKDSTKKMIKESIKSEMNKKQPKIYFRVKQYNTNVGPVDVELNGYTFDEMKTNMYMNSWSSLTYTKSLASSVISSAFNTIPNTKLVHHEHGLNHWHMVNSTTNMELKGMNQLYYVHSYYFDFLAI